MSENGFFPKSLKSIVLSKNVSGHGRLIDSIKNKPGEVAGKILSGLVLTYEDLNIKVKNTICDILSFNGKIEELGEEVKKLNDSIKDKTKAEDITLAVLLARLDMLDKANIENGQEKYYGLIKDTTECTKLYLEKMYEKNSNIWEEIQDFNKYKAVGQYIDATFHGEVNPSMDFANTVVDIHRENNEGKFPEIKTFGNAQSLLVRSGSINAISILRKDEDFRNIYNFSSNNDSNLESKKMKTLNSDIFEGNINSSGLARGNLNQMAELFRSFIISNYNVDIENNDDGIYKDTDTFNDYFFETIHRFNNELIKNKDNSTIIEDINYMLNCPVNIVNNTEKGLKTTTIADCVNFIMSHGKADFINEEQHNILKNFADNISIGKEQNESKIPNLKIMNCEEILKMDQNQVQKDKIKNIITVEGANDSFFESLVPRKKQQIETNDIDNNKDALTKEEKREISSNLHEFLNNLIENKNSDKLLLTLQHYKNVFGNVRPMLKNFEKENKLEEDKKNFLAKAREAYIDSKNPEKNRFKKIEVEKSHSNGIGTI